MLQSRQYAASKHQALRRWVQRCLGQIDHEDRVCQVARRMFRLTSSAHDLAAADLRLLDLATIVHDVGRSIDDDTHPRQGARMLLHEPRLPLNDEERRQLAYLTRYHRGSVPDLRCDGILRRSDPHDRLATILGFLRAADALDSRSSETPEIDFQFNGRKLRVFCGLQDPSEKACRIYSRRKKFRLLEEMLEVRIDVQIVTDLASVAA